MSARGPHFWVRRAGGGGQGTRPGSHGDPLFSMMQVSRGFRTLSRENLETDRLAAEESVQDAVECSGLFQVGEMGRAGDHHRRFVAGPVG